MKMKTICLPIIAMLLTALALFPTAGADENAEAPIITWRDAETSRILFTSDDVISFDWDKQVFLLKRDATLDFLAWIPPHMHQFRRLLVEDAKGPIYQAHWVSWKSSMGFSGPIYAPLSPNPFFSIAKGYPLGRDPVTRDKDPRFAPRLRVGLEKAGVLQSINLNRKWVGLLIQWTGHMWKEVGKDMKVRVEYFENTFRVGQKARAHIFFAGGEETRKEIDSLAIEIKFVANRGTFRSDTRIEGIPVSETEDGIYVCKFSPWEPAKGSDTVAQSGSGLISLTILLQKEDTSIYRLEFAESSVPIE